MYDVEVTYIASTFNTDNTFSLELSDASGDFSSPTVVKTIANQNNTFRFTTTFNLPQTTAGSGYKIRIKSSSPEKISPESDAFEAYFMSSEMLVLNNFQNVTLCEGESKEISVTTSTTNQLQWYKDGQKLFLGGSTISVNEAGLYYCEIYYGSCNSPATSNIIEVIKNDVVEAKILGDSTVTLCENDSYTLEASVDNSLYSYTWFKNGIKITDLPAYSPSITVSNAAFGTYQVEITNENGCSNTSNEVTLTSVSTNFSINTNTATPIYILTGETKVLEITHTAQNAEINWFKDGIQIPNSNTTSIAITEAGNYYATVKSTVNNCTETKTSETILVNNFANFEAIINTTSNYTECVSAETQLLLESVKAKDANGDSYDLTTDQIALLNFKWFKDNSSVNGFTDKQISIVSYENNGSYFLEVSNGAIVSNSNTLDVNLKLPEVEITSNDATNAFCDNKQITLSTNVINGLNYQWFLNNSAISNATSAAYQISEPGLYYVEISNQKGCKSKSNEITISSVDTGFSVSVNSTTPNFILSGETKVLEITHTAQNAEINWFKDDIQIPNSNTTRLTITESGNYYATVKNTVNGCSETKASGNIIINSIEGFNAVIKTLPDYSECSSVKTQLLLESIKARDANQTIYDLTNSQINLLNFNWYKDNSLLNGFTEKQITIDNHEKNGDYFLEITNASATSQSNTLNVKLGVLQPEITSNDHTNTFCDGKQITLNSTQQNDVTYQWFLNGSAITNATTTSVDVTSAGIYQIEVTNKEGCTRKSSEFTINSFNSNFTVSSTTQPTSVILDGETKVLTVNHTAQNALITWFKDDIEIPNSNSNSITITEPGVYFATVKNTVNGCSETKSIDTISVNSIDGFTTVIKTLSDYSACSSLQTQLFLENLQAKDATGKFYSLNSEQIALLQFKWYKDDSLLNGAITDQITIDNYEKNGSYFLEVINGDITSKSNTLEINLGLPEVTVTSSDNSLSLCSNKEITLSTQQITGINYQWFFNGTAITGATNTTLSVSEVGKYTVEATGFSCSKTSQEIIINSFDAAAIEFNFEDEITIQEGESIILSASGADTYEWFDENNNLIETSSSIEISTAGNYKVIAYLNGCSVEKLFTVIVVSGNVFVPNILTPNGDGVNDFWKIPAEFAFKNNIEIEIISISGKTVLKQKNYQNNWPENSTNTASVYFYIIRDNENIIKKGTINILK